MNPTRPWPARLAKLARSLAFLLIIDGALLAGGELIAGLAGPPYHAKVVRHERLDRPKGQGEKRVFVYGESTVYGFPYGAANSTARWLELILADVLPGEQVRVVNFGRPARGSFHLRQAMEETIDRQPDAIVLCLGHNEFLPRSLSFVQGPAHRWCYFHSDLYRNAFDAVCEVRNRKLNSGGTYAGIPPWCDAYGDIMNCFAVNVAAMVRLAQDHDIPIVLCAPACNLADNAPSLSMLRPDTAGSEWEQFLLTWGLVRQAGRRQDPDAAVLARALEAHPHFAEFHYWHGRAETLAGRHEQAYQAFSRARDFDGLPFRCQSRPLAILKEVAERLAVPFVDLPDVFRTAAGGRAPGLDLFMDACHPRPQGQYLIARAMARALADGGVLAAEGGWHWDRLPDYGACLARVAVKPEEWRAPERAALLVQLDMAPELVEPMTDHLPAGMGDRDLEWRALRALGLYRCGRLPEGLAVLSVQDWPAVEALAASWPPTVRGYWLEYQAAARELAARPAW